MKNTIVAKCKCVNEGQDNIHGPQMRVFNRTIKESGDKFEYRCSVCGNTMFKGKGEK